MNKREFIGWLGKIGVSTAFFPFMEITIKGLITTKEGVTTEDSFDKLYLTLDPFQAGKMVRECEIKDGRIKISDEWFKIVRTDLMDDICTSGAMVNLSPDKYGRLGLGARITKDYFAVIDSFSDG